jgi:hypothetical protein
MLATVRIYLILKTLTFLHVSEFKSIIDSIVGAKLIDKSVLERHKTRGKLLARERIEHLIGI